MPNSDDLRKKLKDYYGTAMFSGNPMAVIDLSRVDSANDEELEKLANKAGINNPYPFSW